VDHQANRLRGRELDVNARRARWVQPAVDLLRRRQHHLSAVVGGHRSAHLPFGFADLCEQVWLCRQSDQIFEICCIPFRAYGLALRDVVRVSPDGTLVIEKIKPSGSRVVRALLMANLGVNHIRDASEVFESIADRLGLLYEWSGDRHIAVDVPPEREAGELLETFTSEQNNGRLRWEWADVVPFST
jgi:hypothetical protein